MSRNIWSAAAEITFTGPSPSSPAFLPEQASKRYAKVSLGRKNSFATGHRCFQQPHRLFVRCPANVACAT